ncbi:MAG: NERD domain-containing protein [Lachnospiraceae bacterium]|nr:NERD domain-containing protein [Lachnospiraceae bacterium]
MGLFSRCGPVFLKENSEASVFIEKMQILSEKAEGECKKEIDKQLKIASYGLAGEETIAFELKNSGLNMFILHDIYLQYEDLFAQIDYLIVAPKNIYVIECKNLIGNIEIDNKGGFIRSYNLFGKKLTEGIYSPITQNERHLNVIKAIRKNEKNALSKIFFEKNFDNTYKSIVCLANPKTILNDKYAKKEVKDKVVRADQLIAYIKKMEQESKNEKSSEKSMRKLAEFFLNSSVPNKSDYASKYEDMLKQINIDTPMETPVQNQKNMQNDMPVENEKLCPKCGGKLILRTAKRGNYAGSQFYGCENYPKCRFIENIK